MSTTTNTPSLVLEHYRRGARDLPALPASPSLADVIGHRLAVVDLILTTRELAPGGLSLVIPADPSRPARPVQNLGWLLRHAGDVRHPAQGLAFTVSTWCYRPLSPPPTDGYGRLAGPLPVETFDPILVAHLADGRTYATQWASPDLLHAWLDRPSFRGHLCAWDGRVTSTTCAIGGADWQALDPSTVHIHPSRRGAQVPA